MPKHRLKPKILDLVEKGYTYSEVASRLDTTRGVVCGVMYRHKAKSQQSITLLPKPHSITPSRIENQNTDHAQWNELLARLRRDNAFIRIMHMNDVHLPYHDVNAIDLFLQIAERFQPHIIVVGSDMLDLPTISAYETDSAITINDWLRSGREWYWSIVDVLKRTVPSASLVWIFGNHDQRAIKAIHKSSLPDVAMEYFIKTIKADGRVMYLGNTEVIEIGQLVIAHGNKAGRYPANGMQSQWVTKYVNAGHAHRPQSIGNAMINGMLCQRLPHYADKGYTTGWSQGTATMSVSGDTVLMTAHRFELHHGALICDYGGDILMSEIEADMERVA